MRNTWTAYDRGMAARVRGKPYSSNPYKYPASNISWSLGWRDFPTANKGFPVMRLKLLKRLKEVR